MKTSRLAKVSALAFVLLVLGFLAGYVVDRWSENKNASVQAGTMPAVCGGCPSASSCDLPERIRAARATEDLETEGTAADAR